MNAPAPSLAHSRRTALVLSASSALAGSVGPIAIGSGGLAGASLLSGDAMSLATMPVTGFVIGSAMAAIPAAMMMRQLGRRVGFITGSLIGGTGAVLCGIALAMAEFWFFALGMMVLGGAGAFLQQYRFAAADASHPEFKDRAIAWVMAAGIVSGIAGPQIAIHARHLWPDSPFSGPYLVLALLFVLTVPLLSFLRIPRLALPASRGRAGRPLRQIVTQPRFMLATLVIILAYAMMSLVMTATPLAMVQLCGHSVDDAQLGILFHVLAMFGPSFFTGQLITRFGRSTIAGAGFVLIGAAVVTSFTGTGVVQFWILLTLLGIGWNFGFIAGTAMITDLYRPEEAAKTQAFSEFVLFACIALVTFASGALISSVGWVTINVMVLPIVLCGLGLILVETLVERHRVSAA